MKKRKVISVLAAALFISVIFSSCAQKSVDTRSFVVKESVRLAQEMQNNFVNFYRELEDSVDLDTLKDFGGCDVSHPGGAVVISVDSDLTADYLESIGSSDPSDDFLDFYNSKTIGALMSYIIIVLNQQGYNVPLVASSSAFSGTHIEKAPEDFINCIVFMDYDDYMVITTFNQYDDYVNCAGSYIIPDMSADDFVDAYDTYLETSIGTGYLSHYADSLSSSQLSGIIGS
jgi:hypothetical protein